MNHFEGANAQCPGQMDEGNTVKIIILIKNFEFEKQ